MGERKKMTYLEDEEKTAAPNKSRRGCLCGRTIPPLPCHRYAVYTDGYCRKCSHARACCKGKKRGRR